MTPIKQSAGEEVVSDLERLARALCVSDGLDPDTHTAGQFIEEAGAGAASYEMIRRWQVYVPAVRALLQELREPSEGMLGAICETIIELQAGNGTSFSVPGLGADTPRSAFTKMIDHILSEGAER